MEIKQYSSRNDKIDLLRGYAILLVVLGHCIQCLNHGNVDEFSEPNYSYIYSFHMPLFICISGFLYSISVAKKNAKDNIVGIIKNLCIPHVSWSLIISFLLCLINNNLSINPLMDTLKNVYLSFWFIFVLIAYELLFLIISRIKKYKYLISIFIFICLALSPFSETTMYAWLFPYFLLGYWINENKKIFEHHFNKWGKALCLFAFPLLIVNWSTSFLVYASGMNIWDGNLFAQIFYNSWRWVTGLVGIGSIYIIATEVENNALIPPIKKLFVCFGKNSYTIYLLQSFLVERFLENYIPDFTYSRFLFVFGICFPIALATSILGVFISFLAKKWRITKFILIGGR